MGHTYRDEGRLSRIRTIDIHDSTSNHTPRQGLNTHDSSMYMLHQAWPGASRLAQHRAQHAAFFDARDDARPPMPHAIMP